MKKSEISIKANRKVIPLDKYAGEWVAFVNGKVVAHGKTLKGLMKRVRKRKGGQKPSVMLVPKKREGNYII